MRGIFKSTFLSFEVPGLEIYSIHIANAMLFSFRLGASEAEKRKHCNILCMYIQMSGTYLIKWVIYIPYTDTLCLCLIIQNPILYFIIY